MGTVRIVLVSDGVIGCPERGCCIVRRRRRRRLGRCRCCHGQHTQGHETLLFELDPRQPVLFMMLVVVVIVAVVVVVVVVVVARCRTTSRRWMGPWAVSMARGW